MDRIYVMQLVQSFQSGGLTRRQFMSRARAALGSAALAQQLLAACTPTPAQPPRPVVIAVPSASAPMEGTSEEDVITGMVEYVGEDGETLTGYLARPKTGEAAPGVIVIQEWWGLNEHIKDVTRRLAREGFVALAPDLYHGVVVSEPDEARKLVMELDMAAAIEEIRNAIDYLQAQNFVSGTKVGVVGFCMGGRLSLQTARAEPDLGAVVAFYGSPLTPEEVTDVTAPVLGLYGSEDGGIPVSSVRAMEDALKQAGIDTEIQVYEGAGHAFFNDTRQSYHPEAAADAWQRTLAWFRRYLGAGS